MLYVNSCSVDTSIVIRMSTVESDLFDISILLNSDSLSFITLQICSFIHWRLTVMFKMKCLLAFLSCTFVHLNECEKVRLFKWVKKMDNDFSVKESWVDNEQTKHL